MKCWTVLRSEKTIPPWGWPRKANEERMTMRASEDSSAVRYRSGRQRRISRAWPRWLVPNCTS